MEKISSNITKTLKIRVPFFIIICSISAILTYVFFNISNRILINIFLVILLVFFAWLSFFRKLTEVYLGDKVLKVDGKIINFEDLIAIESIDLYNLIRITYDDDGVNKKFVFRPYSIPFFKPKYFKEIEEVVKKNTLLRKNENGR